MAEHFKNKLINFDVVGDVQISTILRSTPEGLDF
jgi:hypothetical protein